MSRQSVSSAHPRQSQEGSEALAQGPARGRRAGARAPASGSLSRGARRRRACATCSTRSRVSTACPAGPRSSETWPPRGVPARGRRADQPDELASERPYGPWSSRGCDVWDAIRRRAHRRRRGAAPLLARDPKLARYGEPLRFAVREGHLEAVQVLLDAGADADAVRVRTARRLATVARDRGHEAVARLLEALRGRSGRTAPAERRPRITPSTRPPTPTTWRRARSCSMPSRSWSTAAIARAGRRCIARCWRRRTRRSSCCSIAAPTSMRGTASGPGDDAGYAAGRLPADRPGAVLARPRRRRDRAAAARARRRRTT